MSRSLEHPRVTCFKRRGTFMGKRKRRGSDSDSSEGSLYQQSADGRDSDGGHSEDTARTMTFQKHQRGQRGEAVERSITFLIRYRRRLTRESATNDDVVGASPTKGAGKLLAALNIVEDQEQYVFIFYFTDT